MWVNNGIGTLAGSVVDNLLEIVEVSPVEATSEASSRWRETLHEEANTESVESSLDEPIDG